MPQPPHGSCSTTCATCGAPGAEGHKNSRRAHGCSQRGISGLAEVLDGNEAWQPSHDSHAASIAELRAIVERMALRQDRLIDVVEKRVHQTIGARPFEVGDQKASCPTYKPMIEITSQAQAKAAPDDHAESQTTCEGTPGPARVTVMTGSASTVKGFASGAVASRHSGATSKSKTVFRKRPSWWMEESQAVEPLPSGVYETRGFCECDANTSKLVRRIVETKKFELISGSIIVINMITLFVQLQWHSCDISFSLGFSEDDCGWSKVSGAFDIGEHLFNAWYIGELVLRMYGFRGDFLKDPINMFDAAVVCLAFVQRTSVHVPGVAPLRMLRLLRAMRVVRFIRLLLVFKELHILLKTLTVSFFSLHWSMCLIGVLVVAAGLLVMQLLQSYLRDSAQDFETREYLYMTYGTPFRATYSMFVATFSAQWVPMAREMIEHVSPFLACFWVLYVVSVNFAVIRVVSALFLRQTLDIASHDSERRAMENQKNKARFARTLHEIFARADESGDGLISRQEFVEMVDDPAVLSLFATLHLDYEEVCALFEVISGDDGHADYEEFLTGALKMKGSARTFDVIQILHQLGSVSSYLHAIGVRLGIDEQTADLPMQLETRKSTDSSASIVASGA